MKRSRKRDTDKEAMARCTATNQPNPDFIRRDQELRRSSAASAHRSDRQIAMHSGHGTRAQSRRDALREW